MAPRRFRPNLPRDLETITLKAIEKDPRGDTRRPARWPTTSRGSSPASRSTPGPRPPRIGWPGGRRPPGLAALASLLVAVTALAFAGITSLWVVAVASRDRATAAAAEAKRREAAKHHADTGP